MPVFVTESGHEVPSVTADEMRHVDRVAVEGVELGMLQMVENAGRTLAGIVRQQTNESAQIVGRQAADATRIVVLAGGGGNGAGGLCAVRHLRNHGWPARPLLDRDPTDLSGPASRQCRILTKSGVEVTAASDQREDGDTGLESLLGDADLVVDALIGYGLSGPPRGTTARLIEALEASETPVVSLDVPSGLLATTGETPGVAVSADLTLTLALPKTGFADDADDPDLRPAVGDLLLADIGIPPAVYRRVGFGPMVTDEHSEGSEASEHSEASEDSEASETNEEGDDETDAGNDDSDPTDAVNDDSDDNEPTDDQTVDPIPYRQPFDARNWVRLVDVRR